MSPNDVFVNLLNQYLGIKYQYVVDGSKRRCEIKLSLLLSVFPGNIVKDIQINL